MWNTPMSRKHLLITSNQFLQISSETSLRELHKLLRFIKWTIDAYISVDASDSDVKWPVISIGGGINSKIKIKN